MKRVVTGEVLTGPERERRGAPSLALRAGPIVALMLAGAARAQDDLPIVLREVKFEQHYGRQVPPELRFRDEAGRDVELRRYFTGKPVVLVLAYYRCPMLCTQVLNGIVDSLRRPRFGLRLGEDFQIVTVSFDAREHDLPELVAAKKVNYVKAVRDRGHPRAEEGWHFLTGEQAAIDALADAVGFRYKFDPKTDQFAHPSGVTVLTPDGRVARYLYGISYTEARDLRLALVEASENEVGSAADRVLLMFCYHYDPDTGRYTARIMNLVRLAGAAMVLALGTYMARGWLRDWRGPRPTPAQAHGPRPVGLDAVNEGGG